MACMAIFLVFADLNNHVCVSNIDGVHYDPKARSQLLLFGLNALENWTFEYFPG